MKRKRLGLTLVEIVVVIAILVTLSALTATVIVNSRKAARSTECMSHLSQIGQAAMIYAADYNDYWIPYTTYETPPGDWETGGAAKWKSVLMQYGVAQEQFFCPLDPVTSISAINSQHFTHPIPDGETIGRYQSSYHTHPITTSILRQFGFAYNAIQFPSKVVYAGDGPIRFETAPNSRGRIMVTAHGKRANVVYLDGHAKSIPTTEEGKIE